MKKTSILALIGVVALACQNSSVDKKDNMIKYKQTVTLNDVPKSTLTFFEVSDSRCPEGVQCIWAGNATVDLALEGVGTEGKIVRHVSMCLGDCRTLYKLPFYRMADSLEQDFAGQRYLFILESVAPVPKKDSINKKEDYSISLRIEKK